MKCSEFCETVFDLKELSEDPFIRAKSGRFMVKMQLLLQNPLENCDFYRYLRFIYVKVAKLIVN